MPETVTPAQAIRNLLEIQKKEWAGRLGSVEGRYSHYVGLAADRAQWYAEKRVKHRRVGRGLRFAAILLGILAGLVPLVAPLTIPLGKSTTLTILAIHATIPLAVAAGLVLLDKFFGFSTTWLRFVQTEQAIVSLADKFQADWQKRSEGWTAPMDAAQRAEAGKLIEEFVGRIDALVQKETNVWIAEFTGAMAHMDESASGAKTPA